MKAGFLNIIMVLYIFFIYKLPCLQGNCDIYITENRTVDKSRILTYHNNCKIIGFSFSYLVNTFLYEFA